MPKYIRKEREGTNTRYYYADGREIVRGDDGKLKPGGVIPPSFSRKLGKKGGAATKAANARRSGEKYEDLLRELGYEDPEDAPQSKKELAKAVMDGNVTAIGKFMQIAGYANEKSSTGVGYTSLQGDELILVGDKVYLKWDPSLVGWVDDQLAKLAEDETAD